MSPWQRSALVWLALVVAGTVLLSWYHHLAILASGGSAPFLKAFLQEAASVLGVGVLFFAVRRLVRCYPPRLSTRRLLVYAGLLPIYSAVHTSWNWGLREILFRLAGLGDYDYGLMPLRYLMELPADVVGWVVIVVGIAGWDRLQGARRQELHAAQLERNLARAQVRNLRLQLQPHFLFNALNTVSATMFDDPAAADQMLEKLADLLRTSLRTARTDKVTLRDELAMLDAYVAIVRARFGERVRIDVTVEPGLDGALVPSMFLQPLVENAIRHGHAETLGHGAVAIAVRRAGAALEIVVEDDGPGVPEGWDLSTSGLGLSSTAERLELLYGDAHRFAAGNGPDGGFRVRVQWPYVEAEP